MAEFLFCSLGSGLCKFPGHTGTGSAQPSKPARLAPPRRSLWHHKAENFSTQGHRKGGLQRKSWPWSQGTSESLRAGTKPSTESLWPGSAGNSAEVFPPDHWQMPTTAHPASTCWHVTPKKRTFQLQAIRTQGHEGERPKKEPALRHRPQPPASRTEEEPGSF